jgi:hypothetical protein
LGENDVEEGDGNERRRRESDGKEEEGRNEKEDEANRGR